MTFLNVFTSEQCMKSFIEDLSTSVYNSFDSVANNTNVDLTEHISGFLFRQTDMVDAEIH